MKIATFISCLAVNYRRMAKWCINQSETCGCGMMTFWPITVNWGDHAFHRDNIFKIQGIYEISFAGHQAWDNVEFLLLDIAITSYDSALMLYTSSLYGIIYTPDYIMAG